MHLDPMRLIGLTELLKIVVDAVPPNTTEVQILIECQPEPPSKAPPPEVEAALLAKHGDGSWKSVGGWSVQLTIFIPGQGEIPASREMNIHAGAMVTTAARQMGTPDPPFGRIIYRLSERPDGWSVSAKTFTRKPADDQRLPQSLWEILRGDSSHTGLRHVTSNGATYTVKSTQDPSFPGGNFISVTDVSGRKRTIVYDENGRVVKDSGWQGGS